MMPGFVKVAKTDEITPGRGKMVQVNGKKIALFNVEGSSMLWITLAPITVGRFQKGSLKVNRSPVPGMARSLM
jgi:hypothetical protein